MKSDYKELQNYYFLDEEKNRMFYCKYKRKYMKLEQCLVDYLKANAYEKKRSRCYRCKTGRKNREDFANDTDS